MRSPDELTRESSMSFQSTEHKTDYSNLDGRLTKLDQKDRQVKSSIKDLKMRLSKIQSL